MAPPTYLPPREGDTRLRGNDGEKLFEAYAAHQDFIIHVRCEYKIVNKNKYLT
jgi:hypothetical protein